MQYQWLFLKLCSSLILSCCASCMLNFASRVTHPSGVFVLVTRAPRQSPVCALKKDTITIKRVATFKDIRMISAVDMVTREVIFNLLFLINAVFDNCIWQLLLHYSSKLLYQLVILYELGVWLISFQFLFDSQGGNISLFVYNSICLMRQVPHSNVLRCIFSLVQ